MRVLKLESLDVTTRERLLNLVNSLDEKIKRTVARILDAVRRQGDAALREYTKRFDRVQLESLRVSQGQIRQALKEAPPTLIEALDRAKFHIERFHRAQRLKDYRFELVPGVELGQLVKPFGRIGIYVPRNLPSSLLMAAIPARLAGVKQLTVCTPPHPDGTLSPSVRAAASLLEIDELYAVGGVQAIGAMAYGTESIQRVEKIVGPGNAYVTAAKALVRDEVGIDLLAGPSEVLLWVEPVEGIPETKLASWALAELSAQLEHGPGTSALLLTRLPGLAQEVAQRLTWKIIADRHVTILSYEDSELALEFVNDYAPEHLCLWGERAESLLERVTNAGSIFLGPWSAVALGDYASGTNHILPTARQARFHSGLSVRDFVKIISYQRVSPQGLQTLAPTVMALAEVEQMAAHAASVNMRLEAVSCARA